MFRYCVTKDDEDEMYLNYNISGRYWKDTDEGYILRRIDMVHTNGNLISSMTRNNMHDSLVSGMNLYYSQAFRGYEG